MIIEKINKCITERVSELVSRQNNVQRPSVYEILEKAKLGQEGEVRTHTDGTKWKKQGKEWVPLRESRTPPPNGSSKEKNKPKEDEPKPKPEKKRVPMPSHVSRQHIGVLRHIKKLVGAKNYAEAHTLATPLPEEIKHEIPADIWHKMVEAGHNASMKEEKENKTKDLAKEKDNKSKTK
jgi:hypothetical protein